MTARKRTVNRSATDRLAQVIKAELERQQLTAEEAARAARLPAKAFRSLLGRGHRPTIDRADELCRALGITIIIGKTPTDDDEGSDVTGGEEQRDSDG